MKYSLGCRRSHPSKLLGIPGANTHPKIAHILTQGQVSQASLQQFEPPRLDQTDTGSCTAHSASGGIDTDLSAAGQAPPHPSPKCLYAVTRAGERAASSPSDQTLPALQDGGAELADVVAALAAWGVAPMQGPTPTGANSDVYSGNVNEEPDFAQLEAAATKLVVGPYLVDQGAPLLDTCAAAIVAGHPLYCGFYADSTFMNWSPGQPPVGATDQNDPNGGGHAVFIDSFTTNPDGSRTWRLVNSWSTSWGDGGACLVSDAFITAAWELWVLDITVKGGA